MMTCNPFPDMRALSVAVLLTPLAVFAQAPEPEYVIVEKVQAFNQNGSTLDSLGFRANSPPDTAPYEFRIRIDSPTDISSMPQPTFAVPAGSSYPSLADSPKNKLVYVASEGDWMRRFLFGQKYNVSGGPGGTPGGLDGLFNNGTYTVGFTYNSAPASLDLRLGAASTLADVYPQRVYATGLDASRWASGLPVYSMDPTQAFSVTTNAFSGFFTNGYLNRIEISVSGPSNFYREVGVFSNDAGATDSLSLLLQPGDLINGQTYHVQMQFITASDVNSATYAGVVGAAIFTSQTYFALQAVPEPSTYAAWAGFIALTAVIGVRRRARR